MQEHRLLIVEDACNVAMDIERRLEKLGYTVSGIAANGTEALRLVEDCLPDLILMDIRIQGERDGIDVAARIHQHYHIPVIFLTAFSEDGTLNKAGSLKPCGYILKPFSERDLHSTIQVALERFEFDDALRARETHLRLALASAGFDTGELPGTSEPLIFGHMPPGELQHIRNWDQIHELIVDSDRQRVDRQIELLRKQNNADIEVSFQIRDDMLGHRWLVLYGKSYPDSRNHGYRAVGVLQDITERCRTEDSTQQTAATYQYSADGIVILDSNKKVLSANRAFYRISGFNPVEVMNCELSFLCEDQLVSEVYHQIWEGLSKKGSWQGELRGYCKNGEAIYAWVNIAAVPGTFEISGQYVVVFSDITEVHDARERLSHIAYYDSLTNLPNRNLFLDRLDHALARSRRERTELALLFIDLDHFKRINDTLGHQVGDVMLRSAAQRLKNQLRQTDTLCRIGGDEFIVIAEDIQSSADAEALSKKLLSALEKPLKLGVVDVIPSGSIGISLFPRHTEDRDELIKMADTAMYASKSAGRNHYCFYQPEMTEHAARYLLRERELREALASEQFRIFYQPQFSTLKGELLGLEALMRWEHPDKGLLAAGEIIPVAESSSLIVDIGEWVVRSVCEQLRAWLDGGHRPPRVAINSSVRNLQSKNFVSYLINCLNEFNVPPELIEFEVTESCLQDCEQTIECLNALQEKGITISIDDFGTGYSCMSSLKSLPIHKLKIDQSFVIDVPHDPDDCAIASAITALGKQMQLTVIAEGIETREQAEFMKGIGCDALQGYLFALPMPAEKIAFYFNHPAEVITRGLC